MEAGESAGSSGREEPAAEPEDIIATTVLEHDNKLNYLHDQLAEQQKTLTGILKLLKAQSRSLSGQEPSPWNLKDGTGEQQRKILRQLKDWIDWYNCETFSSWSGTGWQDRNRPLHPVDVTLGTTDPQGVLLWTCPFTVVDWPVPVRPTSVA